MHVTMSSYFLWSVLLIPGVLPCDAALAQSRSSPPVLVRVNPTSGPAGAAYPIEILIRGRGFAREANTVTLGPATVAGVPSPDGVSLTVNLPKLARRGAEALPMVLLPGEYELTVTTSAGTSNALQFTLTQ